MIRPPPRSTLFPYTTALPISPFAEPAAVIEDRVIRQRFRQKLLKHGPVQPPAFVECAAGVDRKSTRLNSSHTVISYAVFCLKKKKKKHTIQHSYSITAKPHQT